MADTDLLFKIIAQDEYKAKLQEAAALVDKMTDAEKQQVVATHQQAEAERDLANAAQESKGAISDVRESINSSLVGIQSGIGLAREGIEAFKKAWDFVKEGAALERIQTQFENMAASAGVNSENLLKALDKAAHGTVDDEALMQTATRAFALGLTSNAQDLTKLMEIARASSVAFGGDTASAFERISTAVENLTPRALKQSGIIVDLNQAYKDYAVQLGKNAASLTDEEKRQALLNQVLDKGAELVNKIGNQSEDTATKMARFQTKVTDLFEELKKAAAEGATPLIDEFNILNLAFDQSATDLDRLRAAYEFFVDAGLFPTKEAADQARLAVDLLAAKERDSGDSADYATRHTKEFATALAQANSNAQIAAASDLVNYINAEEAAMKRTSAAAKEMADLQLGILKVGLTGQVQNEMTAFEDKQASLGDQAKKLADQIAELEGKQGDVAKATTQHAMSANELYLANIKLAESEATLSKERDPMKQAELSAQIAVQRDRINEANTSVVTYVDNSKRISELKGQYEDINKEIEKNADAHDVATKRIIFGYLEQQLAAKGLTEAALPVLDKLSVQWGLKSKEDVKAIENVMIAVNQFAKTGNLEVLMKSTGLALTDVGKSAEDASKLTAGLSDLTKGQASTTQESHATMKTSIDETKSALGDWGRKLDELTVDHVGPLTSAMDGLNLRFYGLRSILNELPAVPPFFELPNPTPITTTPFTPSTPGGTRTPVLQGGAQHGADFVVPPNPRGGSGDYYPVLAAPGEHVSVTPQNGGAGGLPPINITQTFNGAQASPDEYKAAMYQVMIDVINEATR